MNLASEFDDMIKKAIKKTMPLSAQKTEREQLDESYVVQQQVFNQVSENVSQKTKDAHNTLYKGYVESLNKISSEIDTMSREESNNRHSSVGSLKRDEVYNRNAAMLHELYFSNCFDTNSEIYMDTLSYMRLQRDFGTFDDWQRDFMACGLASREGWVITGYDFYLKRFVNTIVDLHSENVMMAFFPVIVVDMWSHAYYRDYLDDKKSYMIAVMKELNWGVIESRFKSVDEMVKVLK